MTLQIAFARVVEAIPAGTSADPSFSGLARLDSGGNVRVRSDFRNGVSPGARVALGHVEGEWWLIGAGEEAGLP